MHVDLQMKMLARENNINANNILNSSSSHYTKLAMTAPTAAMLSYDSHPTLYFGVELEFSLAWVDPNEPDITGLDPRALQCCPTAADEQKIRENWPSPEWNHLDKSPSRDFTKWPDALLMYYKVRDKLRQALHQANLPVKDGVGEDIKQWTITDDSSIGEPEGQDDRYKWEGIELISPAYQYTSENVAAVKTACEILTNDFLIVNDESTGLHVHVSYGLTKMWEMSTLRKFLQFIWAFNKQFDSIHPEHRQQHAKGAYSSTGYAGSMRSSSKMARDHWEGLQVKMSPLQGVVHIGKQETWLDLLKAVSGNGLSRFMAYNVTTILGHVNPMMDYLQKGKPTVEFRQHTGSVDPDVVTNWIKLLCSVVKWVDIADPRIFNQLIMVCEDEWVKSGDQALDAKNELRKGPILAEGSFTIIDLLEYMNLQDLADFYRTRLHPVVPEPPLKAVKWRHQIPGPDNLLSPTEKRRAELMKEIWLKMNAYQDSFDPPTETWHWDPDHPMWPVCDGLGEGASAESPPPFSESSEIVSEESNK